MGEGPLLPESSAAPVASERFDSWKEIAAYLRRDIRTVQRWEEEESLPVHRHQHSYRASVYAFKSELDAWRAVRERDQSGRAENGAPAENQNGAISTNGVTAGGSAPRTSPLANAFPVALRTSIGIVLALAIGIFAFEWHKNKPSSLESIWLQENKVVAATQKNAVAWTYELPFQTQGLEASAMLPVSGPQKGADGVAGLFHADGRTNDRLCMFSATGELMWQFSPAETLIFGPDNYGGPWRGAALMSFTSAGSPRIAATFQHEMWWPSMLFVMNLDGRLVGKFVNNGWIRQIQTLERPGQSLLLLFGVSNPYDGGMMAVLDANHPSGSSPSPSGSPYECMNCPSGQPLKYLVFPRSELNMRMASPLNTSRLRADANEIVVVTFEAEDAPSKDWSEGVYRFSPDFELLSATYDDRYWEQHRELELQGKIHHTKANCPDRLGPQSVRAWDPEHGWTILHPNQKAR